MQHETLGACPLCGDPRRELLHAALVDDSFRAVEGRWSLWRCTACTGAYLDPRPDRATIGEAYRRYYTHASAAAGPAALSWRGRIRQWMQDGYLQRRYGAPRPASALGAALYAALPPYRHMSDVLYRHLPGPGQGRRLLDVGCGDGGFLRQAQACGWQVEGVEPDAQAVAEGARQGVPVRQGGLEVYAGQAGCFDLITLSHVIEHLHDPAAALADCRRLLKPGGTLWLATPNIDSLGHARFGTHWRGLEAPRHLVLFNEPTLRALLRRVGFVQTRRQPSQLPEPFMLARASHAMAGGLPPHGDTPPLPRGLWWRTWWQALHGTVSPRRREFLYFTAQAPRTP